MIGLINEIPERDIGRRGEKRQTKAGTINGREIRRKGRI